MIRYATNARKGAALVSYDTCILSFVPSLSWSVIERKLIRSRSLFDTRLLFDEEKHFLRFIPDQISHVFMTSKNCINIHRVLRKFSSKLFRANFFVIMSIMFRIRLLSIHIDWYSFLCSIVIAYLNNNQLIM